MAIKNGAQILTPSHHVVYICSRFLAYGLPMVYFLVSVSFYLKTYDSAQVKITFTQIGTTILFLVWMTKILVEGKSPFGKKDWVFVLPFIAHLVSGLVSYAHTPFKAWAMEETLRRVFYMILALITIAEFRSEERTKRLWRWLIAAAWVAVGYGVVQFLDGRFWPKSGPGQLDPFIWRQAFGPRVFSTFGNPNFYGNFLVIITPLILASVFRGKGPLVRPFIMILVTLALIFCVDKMKRGMFGGYDPSFQIVFSAAIVFIMFVFWWAAVWRVGPSGSVPWFLILFALLFLNLYSTETKGAWLGFVAAIAATSWLILEYFLRMEERAVEPRKYLYFILGLSGVLMTIVTLMVKAFVIPLVQGTIQQEGFGILWIPTLMAAIASALILVWVIRRPWNLKKVIYGLLVFFVITMGAGVVGYAKSRLHSVSFRIFTWIATWEMIRTEPLLGNGLGTFKIIYPAYRRPQIIVLEGKSNTETDHAEDEYIEVWQDEGLIGFGIYIWMVLTALFCGFKQLRWYSNIRAPDMVKKRKLLEMESDPRSYEVMGLLGAYIGALIHWGVDVSIRFVSSGIFSGLLPGALVAYCRNHANPIKNEVRLSYDRWIRLSLAGVWTIVFLYLGIELVPQSMITGAGTSQGQITFFAILAGIGLFLLLEVLEWGNKPEKEVPFSEQYPDPAPKLKWLRFACLAVIVVFVGTSLKAFAGHFHADVHHNLAIFFSKQGIWKKGGRFDARVNQLPPDIRTKYRKWGGALDHYEQVKIKNPAFPMARYFTGNVYNDWGSQDSSKASQARQAGKMKEAQRLRQAAIDKWDKAEEAYEGTKGLAPNYVQTHHQLGLLFTKRAQHARQWGNNVKAKEYFDKALENFYRYRMLDPVFPPNYDRIIQILLQRGDLKKAQKLYTEAIYYNEVVALQIHGKIFKDRVTALATSLAKLYFTEAKSVKANPFKPPMPQVEQALKYFQKAVEANPKNVDALKGLGFILNGLGRAAEAQSVWRQAAQLAPNDPELKANVR